MRKILLRGKKINETTNFLFGFVFKTTSYHRHPGFQEPWCIFPIFNRTHFILFFFIITPKWFESLLSVSLPIKTRQIHSECLSFSAHHGAAFRTRTQDDPTTTATVRDCKGLFARKKGEGEAKLLENNTMKFFYTEVF